MPTRRRTSRRRTLPQKRGNNIVIYAVIIILALSLLIWVISLIPLQVWIYLLIIAGLLALVAVVGVIIVAIHRAQGHLGEQVVSVVPSPTQRRRGTTPRQPSTYQQGYRANDQAFWHDMRNFKTRGDLFNLTPPQFEGICANLLETIGYTEVEHVGKSRDRGVDIRAIDPGGKRTIAQCKQHNIGVKATSGEFQAFIGAISHHRAEKGIFFTTSEFTPEVVAMNKDGQHGVMLVDGNMLVRLMQQSETLSDQRRNNQPYQDQK
jgi:hypothetical protein